MVLIITKYLIPKGYRGLTIFPFVFIKYRRDKYNLVLLNHERIHLRQQLELLFVFFFFWYLIEFFIRLLKYRNRNLAYRNISFEREAYANESDSSYLKNRPIFRFLNYYSLNNTAP